MGIKDFYKQRKPSKFRYVYRYYDPKKEELERKIRRAKRKLDPNAEPDPEEIKANIRGSIKRQSDVLAKFDDEENVSESIKEKNWKLFLFLALAVVFFIWLFNNVGFGFFKYMFAWLR